MLKVEPRDRESEEEYRKAPTLGSTLRAWKFSEQTVQENAYMVRNELKKKDSKGEKGLIATTGNLFISE